jgi:predicted TIM-barrel fold metal-dependent hydrolase
MTVDVNVTLGRWPFRRVPGDESGTALAQRLRARGVTQAWVSHFDALLHTDLAAVNARLAEECRREPLWLPFGAVNPTLPEWRDDVRRCHEVHRMPGLRLFPNYHGYTLSQPVAAELLEEAGKRRLLVQVALNMEDERTQHPLVRVPAVDAAPLADLVRRWPGLKVIVLNQRPGPPRRVRALIEAGAVFFDISMVEGTGGVAKFAEVAGAERVLFGSHAPLYYWDAASLKIQECGLTPALEERIRHANARALLRAG